VVPSFGCFFRSVLRAFRSMKLCPYCSREMADTAIVCPHCGRDWTTGSNASSKGWWLLAIILALAYVGYCAVMTQKVMH